MTSIRYVRGTLPGLEGEHDIAVLDGDTHISRWVEESRRLDHDQNALPIIGNLIGPESVVYDVGAFIGDWSAYLASKAAIVVAIEPNRSAFVCLNENVRHYPNVVTSNRAMGDGAAVDLTGDSNCGATFCHEESDGVPTWVMDARDPEGATLVQCYPPTLIKLDIEGWEVRALRGAERTLRTYHPTLVVEVNRFALERAGASPEELHVLLTGYGYGMRDLFTEEPWLPGDPRPQFDVVAR